MKTIKKILSACVNYCYITIVLVGCDGIVVVDFIAVPRGVFMFSENRISKNLFHGEIKHSKLQYC